MIKLSAQFKGKKKNFLWQISFILPKTTQVWFDNHVGESNFLNGIYSILWFRLSAIIGYEDGINSPNLLFKKVNFTIRNTHSQTLQFLFSFKHYAIKVVFNKYINHSNFNYEIRTVDFLLWCKFIFSGSWTSSNLLKH